MAFTGYNTRARNVKPILYMQKKHSWHVGKVLPAVPRHSAGNVFADIISNQQGEFIEQGTILRNKEPELISGIRDRARTLRMAKVNYPVRDFVKTAKRRIFQKLNLFKSGHLPAGRGTVIPKYLDPEMIGFKDVPRIKLRRADPLRGRNSNGFLIGKF